MVELGRPIVRSGTLNSASQHLRYLPIYISLFSTRLAPIPLHSTSTVPKPSIFSLHAQIPPWRTRSKKRAFGEYLHSHEKVKKKPAALIALHIATKIFRSTLVALYTHTLVPQHTLHSPTLLGHTNHKYPWFSHTVDGNRVLENTFIHKRSNLEAILPSSASSIVHTKQRKPCAQNSINPPKWLLLIPPPPCQHAPPSSQIKPTFPPPLSRHQSLLRKSSTPDVPSATSRFQRVKNPTTKPLQRVGAAATSSESTAYWSG
jgi:hypothetical protein